MKKRKRLYTYIYLINETAEMTFVLLVMIGTKIEITKIMFFACYNRCPTYPMKMFSSIAEDVRKNCNA